MRLPPAYVAALVAIAGIALFLGLAATGVIPIEGWVLWLYGNVLLLVLMLVFAALGGAFVGMLVAQRILSSREFTPLERSLVDALGRLQELKEGQDRILKRVEALESPRMPR